MADRSELLDQLKIDRSQPEPAGVSMATVAIIVVAALIVGGGVGVLLFGGNSEEEIRAEAKPATPVATELSASAANGAEAAPTRTASRDDRILNASGYITARRIATVSSQITGLITEVRVEEGMLVEEGQVLARLDDELAQVDFDLAEAEFPDTREFIEVVARQADLLDVLLHQDFLNRLPRQVGNLAL